MWYQSYGSKVSKAVMSSTSSLDLSLLSLPMFKGEYYERWVVKMKTLFRSQNFWKVVEKGVTIDGSEAQ